MSLVWFIGGTFCGSVVTAFALMGWFVRTLGPIKDEVDKHGGLDAVMEALERDSRDAKAYRALQRVRLTK